MSESIRYDYPDEALQLTAEQLEQPSDRIPKDAVFAGILEVEGRPRKVAVKQLSMTLNPETAKILVSQFKPYKDISTTSMRISTVHGLCRSDGKASIVMHRYPDNLAARIRLLRSESDGICTGLPLHDALRHAWTVANAILLIHNAGLVWETCKPANVLLDEYDGAVITDIGVARIIAPSSKVPDVGHHNYKAPEQWNPSALGGVTPKSDVWCWACLVLEMVTGKAPWNGYEMVDIVAEVRQNERSPELPDHIPGSLRNLLESCLRFDPSSRPTMASVIQTMESRASDLSGVLKTVPSSAALSPDMIFYVTRNSGQNCHRSLDHILTICPEGSCIIVCAGIHQSNVKITKSLTLMGDPEAGTTQHRRPTIESSEGTVLTIDGRLKVRIVNLKIMQRGSSGLRHGVLIKGGVPHTDGGGLRSPSRTHNPVHTPGQAHASSLSRSGTPSGGQMLFGSAVKSLPDVIQYPYDAISGSVTIEGCHVAAECANAQSGAICVMEHANPLIQFNEIGNCSANGILCTYRGRGLVQHNTSCGVCAESVVCVSKVGSPIVRCNSISGGRAGGIIILGDGKGSVEENRVSENGRAGVVCRFEGSTACVRHNQIFKELSCGIMCGEEATPLICYNDIFDCQAVGVIAKSSSMPLMRYNQVRNTAGVGIEVTESAGGVFELNNFHHNDLAAVLVLSNGAPIFACNTLCDGNGDGFDVGNAANPLIQRNQVTKHAGAGIVVRQGARPLVLDNDITFNVGGGMSIRDGGLGMLKENRVHDNGRAGVTISGHESCPAVVGNYVHNNAQFGIAVHQEGKGLIEGNDIHNHDIAGIDCKTGSHPTVKGNKVHDEGGFGIRVLDDGSGDWSGNSLSKCKKGAFCVSGKATPSVFDNTISDTTGPGFIVTTGATGEFKNNSVQGCGGPGIEVTESADPKFQDNTVSECKAAGVSVSNGGLGQFINNHIHSNKGDNVVVSGGLSRPTLEKNDIYNSMASGVSITDAGKVDLIGNNIHHNALAQVLGSKQAEVSAVDNEVHHGFGPGFELDNAQGDIRGNRIYMNRRPGILCKDRAIPICQENQIFENQEQGVFVTDGGGGLFQENNIYGNVLACAEADRHSNLELIKNTIYDSVGHGVVVGGGSKGDLRGNHIYGMALAGIVIAGTGTAPSVTSNDVHDCQEGGITFTQDSGGTCSGNHVHDNTLCGIEVRNSNPEIVDNEVTGNNDAGIVLCDGGFPVLEGNKVTRNKLAGLKVIGYSEPTVRDNVFESNHSFGILILERGRGVFSNNTVQANKCANVCIKARPDPGQALVPPVRFDGNKILDGLMWGVHIVEEGSADLSNNIICNNQLPGIEADTTSQFIIKNNVISDGRSFGIMVKRRAAFALTRSFPVFRLTDKTLGITVDIEEDLLASSLAATSSSSAGSSSSGAAVMGVRFKGKLLKVKWLDSDAPVAAESLGLKGVQDQVKGIVTLSNGCRFLNPDANPNTLHILSSKGNDEFTSSAVVNGKRKSIGCVTFRYCGVTFETVQVFGQNLPAANARLLVKSVDEAVGGIVVAAAALLGPTDGPVANGWGEDDHLSKTTSASLPSVTVSVVMPEEDMPEAETEARPEVTKNEKKERPLTIARLHFEGRLYTVEWLSWLGSPLGDDLQIRSLEPEVGGEVVLSNGARFENPAVSAFNRLVGKQHPVDTPPLRPMEFSFENPSLVAKGELSGNVLNGNRREGIQIPENDSLKGNHTGAHCKGITMSDNIVDEVLSSGLRAIHLQTL